MQTKENHPSVSRSPHTNQKEIPKEKGVNKQQPKKRVSLEEAFQLELERKKKLAEKVLQAKEKESKNNTNTSLNKKRTKFYQEESRLEKSAFEDSTNMLLSNRDRVERVKTLANDRSLQYEKDKGLNSSRLVPNKDNNSLNKSSSVLLQFKNSIGNLTEHPLKELGAKTLEKKISSNEKPSSTSINKLQQITQNTEKLGQTSHSNSWNKTMIQERSEYSKAYNYLKSVMKIDGLNKSWQNFLPKQMERQSERKALEKSQEKTPTKTPNRDGNVQSAVKEEESKGFTSYFTCSSFQDDLLMHAFEDDKYIQTEPVLLKLKTAPQVEEVTQWKIESEQKAKGNFR